MNKSLFIDTRIIRYNGRNNLYFKYKIYCTLFLFQRRHGKLPKRSLILKIVVRENRKIANYF